MIIFNFLYFVFNVINDKLIVYIFSFYKVKYEIDEYLYEFDHNLTKCGAI
jgi:hypothetical protein